ncbi:MAG TPA: hypothetical protein VIC08_11120 [Cellvibrionaceae bacterium]
MSTSSAFKALLLSALIGGLAAVPVASAQAPSSACQQQTSGISQARAGQIASKAHGGRVIDVRTNNGVHFVRLLQASGRVITVKVDAKSGRLL